MAEDTSIPTLWRSFVLDLENAGRTPKTIKGYGEAKDSFAKYLDQNSRPPDLALVTRDDVRGWLASLREKGNSPATQKNRFVSLRRFFRWALNDGAIEADPMASLKPPTIPHSPVAVLTRNELERLFDAAEGTGFAERRDTAIMSLLLDTGTRKTELANITVDDVDWEKRLIFVTGKGRHIRAVPFGRKAARALDLYLRKARAGHPSADLPQLWLSTRRGPLAAEGLRQAVERRGRIAGVKVHLHQFRHTFAHEFLASGGGEGDLMRLVGWKSRLMLDRYAASTGVSRAVDAHREHSPLDRL